MCVLLSCFKPKARSSRPPSSGGRIALRQFSQSRLRAALSRWSRCSEPWWDFSRLQPMELVFSQRADSNRDESAHLQNRSSELPDGCWLDSNSVLGMVRKPGFAPGPSPSRVGIAPTSPRLQRGANLTSATRGGKWSSSAVMLRVLSLIRRVLCF